MIHTKPIYRIFAVVTFICALEALAQWPTVGLITNKQEFRDPDGKILPDSSIVQLLWSGPDQKIAPIRLTPGAEHNGHPVGDDHIIAITRVGCGQPSGSGKIFHTLTLAPDSSHPQPGEWIYLRIFNGADLVAANFCAESQLYRCRGEMGEFFLPEIAGNYQPFELELTFFKTRTDSLKLILEWQTRKEQRLLGYHIFRFDSIEVSEIQLNSEIIAAHNHSGSTTTYQFVDSNIVVNRLYFYLLKAYGLDGQVEAYGPISGKIAIESVLPDKIRLRQNFPNPIVTDPYTGELSTRIQFELPDQANVKITVYNILGEQIKELTNRQLTGGIYQAHWDGKNESGLLVPGGIYFYRIESGSFEQVRKMILIR